VSVFLMIVKKNQTGYYGPRDSVDTRLYRSEVEALTRLHELQAETDDELTLATSIF